MYHDLNHSNRGKCVQFNKNFQLNDDVEGESELLIWVSCGFQKVFRLRLSISFGMYYIYQLTMIYKTEIRC